MLSKLTEFRNFTVKISANSLPQKLCQNDCTYCLDFHPHCMDCFDFHANYIECMKCTEFCAQGKKSLLLENCPRKICLEKRAQNFPREICCTKMYFMLSYGLGKCALFSSLLTYNFSPSILSNSHENQNEAQILALAFLVSK